MIMNSRDHDHTPVSRSVHSEPPGPDIGNGVLADLHRGHKVRHRHEWAFTDLHVRQLVFPGLEMKDKNLIIRLDVYVETLLGLSVHQFKESDLGSIPATRFPSQNGYHPTKDNGHLQFVAF